MGRSFESREGWKVHQPKSITVPTTRSPKGDTRRRPIQQRISKDQFQVGRGKLLYHFHILLGHFSGFGEDRSNREPIISGFTSDADDRSVPSKKRELDHHRLRVCGAGAVKCQDEKRLHLFGAQSTCFRCENGTSARRWSC